MESQQEVQNLFRSEMHTYFDFSQAPDLVTRKDTDGAHVFENEERHRWAKAQASFLRWTRDKRVFTREYIETGKNIYSSFFKTRGPLRGTVLDIGGGWGLFRQWWEPGESDQFVVHDPGIERFLRGPHRLHHDYYQRAFSLPMTFVEGFGEELPYNNDTFDTCLIAAALDHCVDPQRVLVEAYRCLRPGATILVLQSCHVSQRGTQTRHILNRLFGLVRQPNRLLTVLYYRLFQRGHHLHSFAPSTITSWLEQAGFRDVTATIISSTAQIYAFEASKPRSRA